jgi:D-alanyl-D-alanine carboxypeptidase
MNDTGTKAETDFRRLDSRLRAVFDKEGAELSGLAVVVVLDGEVRHEAYIGRRFIDAEDPSRDLPVDGDTKFRIASISKSFVAAAAMILVERGLLDLDRDISDYLDFVIRNPHFPDTPITASMLLSHTSTILDADYYTFPLPMRLSDALAEGGSAWNPAVRFAGPSPGKPVRPGEWYTYCNLNFGILATAMERITGTRFDLSMRELLLQPLGLDASFNVLQLSDEGFRKLAPLYRKAADEAHWNPSGPWRAQVDDYRGHRPACAARLGEGLGPEALDRYEIGTNGTIFSPQGGLRISARDLSRFLRLLALGGEIEGIRLLSPESVARMATPLWTWDPAKRNGELFMGPTRQTGLGLVRGTDSFDTDGGDRISAPRGLRLWGHHADAYGLRGGILFDPASISGFLYIIGGLPIPPDDHRGKHSTFSIWEEEIQDAVAGECLPPR